MSAATFHSAEILLERLQSDKETRPIVFLVGAPLSIAGSDGVPNVATTLDRIREELADLPEARRQLDEHATQLLPGEQYQEAMGLLAAARGQDTVNRLIRTCVLEAYRGTRPPDVRDEEALAALEKDRERWNVPPGVSALGKLVGRGGPRLRNVVLTTNFDPLIEIAIARAGSTAIPMLLDSDGRLDQIDSEYPVVVHLHGFWRRGDTLHVQSQLSKPRPSLVQSLRRALGGSRLVTIAYGGWHDVVAEALVGTLSGPGEQPEVLWTFYGTNEPSFVGTSSLFFDDWRPNSGPECSCTAAWMGTRSYHAWTRRSVAGVRRRRPAGLQSTTTGRPSSEHHPCGRPTRRTV